MNDPLFEAEILAKVLELARLRAERQRRRAQRWIEIRATIRLLITGRRHVE